MKPRAPDVSKHLSREDLKNEVSRSSKSERILRSENDLHNGLAELNGMLKDENVNVVDVRAADDFRQRSCARRGKFAQGKMGRVTRAEEDKINVLYCYTQQCHLAANAALEFASRDELDVEK
jgi:hypothetical protein